MTEPGAAKLSKDDDASFALAPEPAYNPHARSGGVSVERSIPSGGPVFAEPRGTFEHFVAAGYVLPQRAGHTSIRNMSHLAVWSADRRCAS